MAHNILVICINLSIVCVKIVIFTVRSCKKNNKCFKTNTPLTEEILFIDIAWRNKTPLTKAS